MMKMGWFQNYHAKYMAKGYYRPVVHVIMLVMAVGYAMEYPHLKHDSHAAKKKAALAAIEGGGHH